MFINFIRFPSQGGRFDQMVPTEKDAKDYRDVLGAMKILEFGQDDINAMLVLLAAIIHFGNIEFLQMEGLHNGK